MKPAPARFWRAGVVRGKAVRAIAVPDMAARATDNTCGIEPMIRLSIRPANDIAAVFAVAIGMAVPTGAMAADPVGAVNQCVAAENAELMQIDDRLILQEQLDQRFNHSVEVADSEKYISSTRPTFVWASETKVACGKAIGYLKSNTVDAQYINKCECFYDRMVRYLD